MHARWDAFTVLFAVLPWLSLLKPDWWLRAGISELVRLLQQRGAAVFLVSGGFRVIINPIADILGIPRSNVFANSILHDVRPMV